MDKEQIISEFNSREKKLKEEYSKTDGARYLRTIPPDPYCRGIDMPKEKFPEYHKYYQDIKDLNNEYSQFICSIAKYKKGDFIVVGCEDSIEFGTINNETFFINQGDDVLYQIKFDKSINCWKYGSSGGSFGENSCTCAFNEKDVLMKVSAEEMEEMNKIPINGLKIMYPELFVIREHNEKLDGIKNLVCGFIDKVNK
jgi:hypothetical protein